MKKILIISYFVGMSLVTYLTAKAVSTYKSDDIEVKFRKHERELSDTEISQAYIKPVSGKNVVEKWETKETRTKTLLGWETKIDTIGGPQTYYVDCGCGN
jgi:hypothetical protein